MMSLRIQPPRIGAVLFCILASVWSGHSLAAIVPAVPTNSPAWIPAAGQAVPGFDLFTNGPVLHLRLHLEKNSVESLRRDHRKSVPATVWEGTTVYSNVAVHIKGSAGSLRDIDDRPALTLDFSKNLPRQKFHGLRKIHLNNSVQDPVYLDEEICGELFRAAGVPAARTCHATLILNGRNLGLYVLKEGFTKDFLGQYFRRTDGNLYDGGFVSDLSPQTEKISGHGPDDRSDLQAVIAAAEYPDPDGRWSRLNRVVEMDRFLSMMALEVMTVHWDGYSLKPNNYRVYFNPEDRKIVFFVHGMDQMFGRGQGAPGPVLAEMQGLVSRAVLSTPAGRQRYLERFRQIYTQLFQLKPLTNRLAEIARPIRAEMAGDPAALRNYDAELNGLRERITDCVQHFGREIAALASSPSAAPPR